MSQQEYAWRGSLACCVLLEARAQNFYSISCITIMSHRRNYPIYNGQNGAGNWRRRGPPKTPAETQQYFCEICHVSCVGDQSYQAHLVGKAHRKKEDVATGRKVLDSALAAFVCEVCNATCTGKDAYMTHINGVKHSRVRLSALQLFVIWFGSL